MPSLKIPLNVLVSPGSILKSLLTTKVPNFSFKASLKIKFPSINKIVLLETFCKVYVNSIFCVKVSELLYSDASQALTIK